MRRGLTIALAGLCWPCTGIAQEPSPESLATVSVLNSLDPCRASRSDDDILVCGRRDSERYRVPRLAQGRAASGARHVRGEAPRASTDQGESGPCGIFQGQRRCSEAEMAEFGYGGGRDPITFVGAIVARLVDPDAEIGPPVPR